MRRLFVPGTAGVLAVGLRRASRFLLFFLISVAGAPNPTYPNFPVTPYNGMRWLFAVLQPDKYELFFKNCG